MVESKVLSEKERFEQTFPDLAQDIISCLADKYEMPESAVEWFTRNINLNVPGGKMNRGLSVSASLRRLVGRELNADEEKKAFVLGWCVEWLQAFFLVADDLMDSSITRRGQPCWYKRDGVGTIAVNDSFLLESCIYLLLKKYFRDSEYYVDLVELFHEVTYKTELGQMLDLITAPEGVMVLDRFSMEKYKKIVKYKTAFYSFYMPVAMAMMMHGIKDESQYTVAEEILMEMGEFFQIQDDFLDCYGDPEVIGKVGTDIEDNKCGWLINNALVRCTEAQRKVLEDNYAKKDAACVQRVKDVFNELKMKEAFYTYEEESYERLMGLIEKSAAGSVVPKEVYTDFAKKIYKRKY
eukprot:Nk52_evm73s224 gene=Nk52_evmTU73s224